MFIDFAAADLLLFPLWDYFTSSFETRGKILTGVTFFIWWLFTKNVKLLGLYKRDIWDIRVLTSIYSLWLVPWRYQAARSLTLDKVLFVLSSDVFMI
jgi:hypothetical protein